MKVYYNLLIKKTTQEYANRSGHSRNKRVESTSPYTHSEMGEGAGKRRKRYVDHPTGELKTCIIHLPGNSSD